MSIAGVPSGGFRNGQRCDSFRAQFPPWQTESGPTWLRSKSFFTRKSRPVGRNVSSILLESRRISGAVASRFIARWKVAGASTRSNPPSGSASLRVQASGRLRYRRAAPADKHAGAGHKLGFDPRTMPMKPMSVEQCVSEGLNALRENRSRIVPGG